MVNPVNSGFTQPPVTNTFQPGGGNTQTGTAEQRPEENRTQPQQAPAAQSQRSQEESLSAPRDDAPSSLEVANEERRSEPPPPAEDTPRGSLIDVTA